MLAFKRPIQRYGTTPAPETPYQRAAQVWDERIGSARAQAANWRLIAFGSLILAGGLAAGNIWQSLQSRVTPYVVEVDALGEARAVAPALQAYKPSDGEIAWYLARFIRNVRSVSTDPVLVKQAWLDAYDFTSDEGARFLNAYARANDPFAGIGQRSVSVQVTSVVRASPDSFQVKWIEQSFDRGNLSRTDHWTAILSIVTRLPKTADALRRNPLGIFVTAIDWSREFDAAASGATASPPSPAPMAPPALTTTPTSPTS